MRILGFEAELKLFHLYCHIKHRCLYEIFIFDGFMIVQFKLLKYKTLIYDMLRSFIIQIFACIFTMIF